MNIFLKKSLVNFKKYRPNRALAVNWFNAAKFSNYFRPGGQSLIHDRIRYDENHFIMNDSQYQEVRKS
jgi:hypothetical protein